MSAPSFRSALEEKPRAQRHQQRTSHEQRTSNELVKLVRKLRWIGMEDEADTLVEELARRCATDAMSMVALPRDTD